MPSAKRYWFSAKRYGWGWGLPTAWQGWLTVGIFVGLVVADVLIFPPRKELAAFLVCIVVLSVLFVAVAWVKGEPPHWRWGGKQD